MSELRDLLERSPSIVNVAFTEGRTALYWAVCNGREDAIRLLLKHQARCAPRNMGGVLADASVRCVRCGHMSMTGLVPGARPPRTGA